MAAAVALIATIVVVGLAWLGAREGAGLPAASRRPPRSRRGRRGAQAADAARPAICPSWTSRSTAMRRA